MESIEEQPDAVDYRVKTHKGEKQHLLYMQKAVQDFLKTVAEKEKETHTITCANPAVLLDILMSSVKKDDRWDHTIPVGSPDKVNGGACYQVEIQDTQRLMWFKIEIKRIAK